MNGLERNLFFLPRPYFVDADGKPTNRPVFLQTDVQEEVSLIFEQHRLGDFGSKPVTRQYCLGLHDVPPEADYLKIIYPYVRPPLPEKCLAGKSFSHVFGNSTNALEHFIIKRNLMGPCWISLKNSRLSNKNVRTLLHFAYSKFRYHGVRLI